MQKNNHTFELILWLIFKKYSPSDTKSHFNKVIRLIARFIPLRLVIKILKYKLDKENGNK